MCKVLTTPIPISIHNHETGRHHLSSPTRILQISVKLPPTATGKQDEATTIRPCWSPRSRTQRSGESSATVSTQLNSRMSLPGELTASRFQRRQRPSTSMLCKRSGKTRPHSPRLAPKVRTALRNYR